MELSTDRLEATSRTQERPFSATADERKRRTPRRSKDESRTGGGRSFGGGAGESSVGRYRLGGAT